MKVQRSIPIRRNNTHFTRQVRLTGSFFSIIWGLSQKHKKEVLAETVKITQRSQLEVYQCMPTSINSNSVNNFAK